MPEVVVLLQSKPDSGTVTAELPEAYRHIWTDARLSGKHAMERLARDPELPRRLTYREVERWENILAEDVSRTRGRPLLPATNG